MFLASFSKKEQRILLLLSLTTFLIRIPLLIRSHAELAVFPYGDDAYYIFSIAKQLALWHGPSVDGIHLTNGFQPLIALIYTPTFWLSGGDPWFAVRWSFVLGGFIAALFVWAIALLVRTIERSPASGTFSTSVVAAAIWTFSYPCFLQMTNGLETGLASLLIVVSLTLYAKCSEPSAETNGTSATKIHQKPWLLGVVLGFAVLARIDAAILVAIVVFLFFAQRRFRDGVVTGLLAFLISLPWWLFNWTYFGSLMPESGQAENIWPLPPHENIYRAVQSLSDILSLVFYLPDSIRFPLRVLWLIILVAGISIVTIKTKLFWQARMQLRISALVPLILFSVVLIFYYTFFFRAPHFLPRYLQPARILWSIFFAAGLSILWRNHRIRGVIVLVAVLAVAFFAQRTVQNSYQTQSDLYRTGLWAAAHPQEKIGMLQSGVASFVAPNVINLDGKVNEAALRAHQQGHLPEYLRGEHLTVIADDKPFIEDIAAIARKDSLRFDSIGIIGRVELMKLRTATK